MKEQRTLLGSFDIFWNRLGDKGSVWYTIIRLLTHLKFSKTNSFFPYQLFFTRKSKGLILNTWIKSNCLIE